MPGVAKPLHECVSPRRDELCQAAVERGCSLKRRNGGLVQGKDGDGRHSNGGSCRADVVVGGINCSDDRLMHGLVS